MSDQSSMWDTFLRGIAWNSPSSMTGRLTESYRNPSFDDPRYPGSVKQKMMYANCGGGVPFSAQEVDSLLVPPTPDFSSDPTMSKYRYGAPPVDANGVEWNSPPLSEVTRPVQKLPEMGPPPERAGYTDAMREEGAQQAAVESVTPGRKGPNEKEIYGQAMTMMSLGLGQAAQGATSASPQEMTGGVLTFVGGLMRMSQTPETANTTWGKMGPVLALIGTGMNILGKRKSAQMERDYQSNLHSSIAKALVNMEAI